MRDFVNWSITATAVAIPRKETLPLRAGTERLIAFDQGLAFNAKSDVGERF